MSLTPRMLVTRCHTITSLPLVYERLNEAINDPFCDLSRIADILSEDSALSARLLRLANSALYNFHSRIETVTRAVTIIGTKQLRDLVLATSVIEVFRDVPPNSVNMESFWRHSIATGIAARVIATCRREANVERFYVMGLLHDIGRLVLYLYLPEQAHLASEIAKAEQVATYEAERKLINFDHAEVGAELLGRWQLPVSLQEGVGYHHLPQLASRYNDDAATVHIADIIAGALQLGCSGEVALKPFNEAAWERLGIAQEQLPLIIAQLKVQYDAAVDIFLN